MKKQNYLILGIVIILIIVIVGFIVNKSQITTKQVQLIQPDGVQSTKSISTKTYKNEKYLYSFEYPANWYIYDYNSSKNCQGGDNTVAENEIILSRSKLAPCTAGRLDISFVGDISIRVNIKNDTDNIKGYAISPEAESFDIGKNFKEKARQGIKIPRLETSDGPREMSTLFFVDSNKYNYRIEVKQTDTKGNIDPELLNVINNFLIEE